MPGQLTPVNRRQDLIVPQDTAQVTAAMTRYQEGLKSVLDDSDWQTFKTKKEGERRFLKKSGWRKIAFWFGLDLTFVEREIERDPEGRPLRARVIARATHPNGRHADGDGYCSAQERGFSKPENDIPGTAATRAMNRAISNLVGMGDVSAEEMTDEAPAREYGAEVTPRERTGLERAIGDLYGTDTDPDELIARLENDAGGYLPRLTARALMLTAALRPGRTQAGAGTDGKEAHDATPPANGEPAEPKSDRSEQEVRPEEEPVS